MTDEQPDRRPLFLAIFLGIILVIVAAIVIPRIGDDDEGGGGGGEVVTERSPECAQGVTDVGDQQDPGAPEQTVTCADELSAVVATSEGEFTIDLDAQRAPQTVNSFVSLAEDGFFDGLNFHRISPQFVIQGGDPNGDGSGGPGYKVVEAPPGDLAYDVGIVAMAKAGNEAAGTSGSQFFVVTGPNGAQLTPDYALLGEVTEGLDVALAIGELGTPTEQPRREVTIDSITIERAEA